MVFMHGLETSSYVAMKESISTNRVTSVVL